ncbi:hypothetical protein NBT05_01105 [Aquimarina sp. ERC-38]|uniref:hypothetical protein n=1 Tax=Aquimarina sp. ERC-38 TaxID=2949996 RepID=UPI002245B434|nr:hypothetical protein [Aquimarina sp. ERC-38]UZO81089.1 hypothetical protein NBT05_01105 [Aquimarina sp. ERC-38]
MIKNKIIPNLIKEEAITALSHYPELKETYIEFKFKESLGKSMMKAQPKFFTLFRNRKNRKYIILMSRNFTLDGTSLDFNTIPKNVLIGWLGHELGHIMDYRERSSLDLTLFGIRYYFSGKHIREAERTADTFAVTHKMRPYILETKKYILEHVDLSDKYKDRIKKLYLSPDEILSIAVENTP